MKILSHRGYWLADNEKNLPVAIKRSFDEGFGTEIDLRDHLGEIVVSHDFPTESPIRFIDLLSSINHRDLFWALNIKSDGMSFELNRILSQFNLKNYFVFDMSLPDQVKYLKNGMVVFSGLSDLNLIPPLIESSHGIWLDSFYGNWYGPGLIEKLINQKKHVCIVSSELHSRAHHWLWKMIKESDLHKHEHLMLCTDLPMEAKRFFNE